LLARFQQEHFLAQSEAVDLISDAGGDCYLDTNDNGNMSIDRVILKEFRALTETTAIWMKSAQAWRKRDPETDSPDTREQRNRSHPELQ
jgi:hypothetical protein